MGLSVGILCGIALLLPGLIPIKTEYGNELIKVLASVYPGYKGTFGGSIIGLLWGFADGFFGGILLAWLYNTLSGAVSLEE